MHMMTNVVHLLYIVQTLWLTTLLPAPRVCTLVLFIRLIGTVYKKHLAEFTLDKPRALSLSQDSVGRLQQHTEEIYWGDQVIFVMRTTLAFHNGRTGGMYVCELKKCGI